jgi:hypothetical protein
MEEIKYKYICEKCNFYTNAQTAYNAHIITEKHNTGKKAKRCDKKYPEKCSECNYIPKSNTNYLQHILIYHSSKEERKEKFKYFCIGCDFGTFSEKLFDTHIHTDKHAIICNKI